MGSGGPSRGPCGPGSGLRTLRILGFPCEPGHVRTVHRVISGVALSECQAVTPKQVRGDPWDPTGGSWGAEGSCECPLTPAPLSRHRLGVLHTRGCEGLDAGVTRLSALLGLGERLSRHTGAVAAAGILITPNYVVSPRPGNRPHQAKCPCLACPEPAKAQVLCRAVYLIFTTRCGDSS